MNKKAKEVSLSWFIISTRDYKKEYDWIWDKQHHCCYGMPKDMRTDCMTNDLREYYINWNRPSEYFAECILMPELHMYSIDEAKPYIISWCDKNEINYIDDTDQYKRIEANYWGYDDLDDNDIVG